MEGTLCFMVSVFRELCLCVFDNLESGTAQMIRLGLYKEDVIAGFVLRFKALLDLEPKGMVEKAS